MSAASPAGFDGSGLRIVVAPFANGNVMLLPSPYAKNNFGTASIRSSGWTSRIVAPMVRAVASRLNCRCITPFGTPVVPDEYSQKPGESSVVGATGASESSSNPPQSSPSDGDGLARVLVRAWRAEATTTRATASSTIGFEFALREHRGQGHRHDSGSHRAEEPAPGTRARRPSRARHGQCDEGRAKRARAAPSRPAAAHPGRSDVRHGR